MRNAVEIENIEEMRLKEGIDDAELRDEIRGLRVGDFVKLTLLVRLESLHAETLLVRITSIKESVFRGKLAVKPALVGLSGLPAGLTIRFSASHIHSIARKGAGT